LTIGILDKFLWFRFPVPPLVRNEHFPDEIGENVIKDNEQEKEEDKTSHRIDQASNSFGISLCV
jgi:hypothetical protein